MKTIVASAALLAVSTQSVAPISEIFVRESQPEWAQRHEESSRFWEGHNAYHKVMDRDLESFENYWAMKNKDEAYIEAKRALLQRLQLQHRLVHENIAKAQAKIDAVTPENKELVRPVTPVKTSSRITPLPKRSHRLIEKEVYKQLEYRRN